MEITKHFRQKLNVYKYWSCNYREGERIYTGLRVGCSLKLSSSKTDWSLESLSFFLELLLEFISWSIVLFILKNPSCCSWSLALLRNSWRSPLGLLSSKDGPTTTATTWLLFSLICFFFFSFGAYPPLIPRPRLSLVLHPP